MARHAEAGDEVRVFIVSGRGLWVEPEAAAKALGVGVGLANWPDQRFETKPIAELAELVAHPSFNPDIVYTHNPDDLNRDHRLICEAVQIAYRPNHSRATLLAFETISSTEWSLEPFAPNYFVELTADQVIKKCDALRCYPTEIRKLPHPRNEQGIWTQAEFRGAQAGVGLAEAFRLIRHVD